MTNSKKWLFYAKKVEKKSSKREKENKETGKQQFDLITKI